MCGSVAQRTGATRTCFFPEGEQADTGDWGEGEGRIPRRGRSCSSRWSGGGPIGGRRMETVTEGRPRWGS
eukprot:3073388-Rhodomonas_salina.1